MALIKCIECGKEVSEHADKCPNCGCPIEVIKNANVKENFCRVDGVLYDFTGIEEYLNDGKWVESIKEVQARCGVEFNEAYSIVDIIKYNGYKIPVDYNETLEKLRAENEARHANLPKCPTCGSTNIQKIGAVERGASVLGLGILSKKIGKTYKCNNCKYTW